MAWVAHQVPRDPIHLFEANIFYPAHDSLAFSEPLIVPALMGAPLAWAGASPVLVYNVVVVAGTRLHAHLRRSCSWRPGPAASWPGCSRIAVRLQHAHPDPVPTRAGNSSLRAPARAAGGRPADSRRVVSHRADAGVLDGGADLHLGLSGRNGAVMIAIAGGAGARVVLGCGRRAWRSTCRRWRDRRAGVILPHSAGAPPDQHMVRSLTSSRTTPRRRPDISRPRAACTSPPGRTFLQGSSGQFLSWLRRARASRRGDRRRGKAGVRTAPIRVRARVVCWSAIGVAGSALPLGTATPVTAGCSTSFRRCRGCAPRPASGICSCRRRGARRHGPDAVRWQPARDRARRAGERRVAARADGVPAVPRQYPAPYQLLGRLSPVRGPGGNSLSCAVFQNAPYVLASTAHWRPLMNGYSGYTPDTYQKYADAFWYFPPETAIWP